MDQKVEAQSSDDVERLDRQRDWVKGHYSDGARDNYESIVGKLALLHAICVNRWIDASETWKLQSLGVVFGDALAEHLSLVWVSVEDELGRDPALRDPVSQILIYPLTSISKRVELGEEIDISELFDMFCSKIIDFRENRSIN